jgi:hypothetical protein
MNADDMQYQHRGYAKYVEIVALFGWDAIDNFWHSVGVDYMDGIEYETNADPADSRILRMSRVAGADITPLIHFWGVSPQNSTTLKTKMLNEGLKPSAKVYDRLRHYQSIVPMNAAEFTVHANLVGGAPRDVDWYNAMKTGWTEAMGTTSVYRVQNIIDTYFPTGRPADDVLATPVATNAVFYTDFGSTALAADSDGKLIMEADAVTDGDASLQAANPGTWFQSVSGQGYTINSETCAVANSITPDGTTTAALRVGFATSGIGSVNYAHMVATNRFEAGKNHILSTAARIALGNGTFANAGEFGTFPAPVRLFERIQCRRLVRVGHQPSECLLHRLDNLQQNNLGSGHSRSGVRPSDVFPCEPRGSKHGVLLHLARYHPGRCGHR